MMLRVYSLNTTHKGSTIFSEINSIDKRRIVKFSPAKGQRADTSKRRHHAAP